MRRLGVSWRHIIYSGRGLTLFPEGRVGNQDTERDDRTNNRGVMILCVVVGRMCPVSVGRSWGVTLICRTFTVRRGFYQDQLEIRTLATE